MRNRLDGAVVDGSGGAEAVSLPAYSVEDHIFLIWKRPRLTSYHS